jgi:hypothetical protein
VELAKLADHDDLRRKFVEAYHQKLRGEGYQFTDVCSVKHYYYLLFASRDPKGLQFWHSACTYEPDNQKNLL